MTFNPFSSLDLKDENLRSQSFHKFKSFLAKYEKKFGRPPKINVTEIIFINENATNLSTIDYFDSNIKDEILYLVIQNLKYLEFFIEFAAIKCFFTEDHLKAPHFLQMVYLVWAAPFPSKNRIKNYFSSIIDKISQLYTEIYQIKNHHLESQLIGFCSELGIYTIYKEFLISQPAHNQMESYFFSLQTYLITRSIYFSRINIEELLLLTKNYIQKFDISPFIPPISFLKRHIPFIPFYIEYGKLGLRRIKLEIQCPTIYSDKIISLICTLPNILMRQLNHPNIDGTFHLILVCQDDFIPELYSVFENLKTKGFLLKFKFIQLNAVESNIKNFRQISKYCDTVISDISLIDFYLLDNMNSFTGIDEFDTETFGNQLMNNINTFLHNQKRKIKQSLKNTTSSNSKIEEDLKLISNLEKNPELKTMLLERFLFLKFNKIFFLITANIFSIITQNNMIYIPIICTCKPSDNQTFAFSEINYHLLNLENKIIESRLQIEKTDLLNILYQLYQLELDLIIIYLPQKEPISNLLSLYDFSSKTWKNPNLNQFSIGDQDQIKRNTKNTSNIKSYNHIERIGNKTKLKYFDYYTTFEFKTSHYIHFCDFLKKFFIFENISESSFYPEDLSKKMRLNSSRGDNLEKITKIEKRFMLQILGIEINISPVLNFRFIEEIFLSHKAIYSIQFQGGSYNGLLLIDFAEYEDVNHKLLKELANAQLIEFHIYEIIEENRWFNSGFYLNQDFSIQTYAYLSKFDKLMNYNSMEIDRTNKKYFKEYPLLYYVAGFNLTFVYSIELNQKYTFEDICKIFSIFSIGKILHTSENTIFLFLYLDYVPDIIAKIHQFFSNHKIEYKCHQIHNLLEIDKKNPFFTRKEL